MGRCLSSSDWGALDAGALLKGRIQRRTPGLCLLGSSGLPQQGRPSFTLSCKESLGGGCRGTWSAPSFRLEQKASGDHTLGPATFSSCTRAGMDGEGASGRQRASPSLEHGFKFLLDILNHDFLPQQQSLTQDPWLLGCWESILHW